MKDGQNHFKVCEEILKKKGFIPSKNDQRSEVTVFYDHIHNKWVVFLSVGDDNYIPAPRYTYEFHTEIFDTLRDPQFHPDGRITFAEDDCGYMMTWDEEFVRMKDDGTMIYNVSRIEIY